MKNALRLFVCATIVTAFQLRLAAAVVVSEDVLVPGGTDAVARALGVEATPDRARFAGEMMRLAYNIADAKNPLVEEWLQQFRVGARNAPTQAPAAAPELVPIPLTAAVWSDAVFHRHVPADALFNAILGDRQAALICRGLTGLDDETLAFFAEHPAVLRRLYERDAAVFAVFSNGLHIRDNRVEPAGVHGARAGERDEVTPLWEAVLGEKMSRPDRFVPELFDRTDGRTAYLYDSIAALDAPHAAFALGLWLPRGVDRIERLKALNRVSAGAFREWRPKALPFGRPIYDTATVLDRVRVDRTGVPLNPASRAIWARAFNESAAQVEGEDAKSAGLEPVDAAWLAAAIEGDIHQRADRMDQLSFGQRVFGNAPASDAAPIASVLRDFPRYRMLLLTLERIGIRDAPLYATAIATAVRLSELDGYRGFATLAQFQSALALVVRLQSVRVIDVGRVQEMVRELIALPIGADGYGGAVARWIGKEFPPLEGNVENAMIARLAGPRADLRTASRIDWEGQPYRLDLARAERQRLHMIREKQGGLTVDVAVDLEEIVTRLAGDSPDVAAAITELKAVSALVQVQTRSYFTTGTPPGVDNPRGAGEVIQRVIADLAKVDRSKEPRKAAHAVEPLAVAADGVLADSLLSLIYAIDLGDPDGTILLAGNVAHRHDFGLGVVDRDARARAAWAMPHQEVAPGVPWHVAGSALGLELALAPLSLRRTDTGRIGGAPRLTSNERQTFAVSVALLNPFAFEDVDRQAIVDAVLAGRRRVAGSLSDSALLEAVASDASIDPRRKRAILWTAAHEPDRVESMFSLTELLYLGGVPESSLAAWGMADLPMSGCLCTRFSPPGVWTRVTGRPQLGLLATTVPDLNIRIAIVLSELKLPAAIERHVLAAAMQDFIDEVQPTDSDDWLTLVRAARSVTRERIEDYVAAVAAAGPLVPAAVADLPDIGR
ncbi:MAG TPA: hypothetical protein VGJ29_21090 [Vicinamibacterales bacterium]